VNLQVIKKDGLKENFSPDKIIKVVTATGLTPQQSSQLAQKVTQWFQSQKKTQVTTLEIRNKVIEELSKVDQFAVNAFTWYEKTKDGENKQG